MTILIAGGDSFTYGEELLDCNGSPSNLTWSALLAKRLGMSYCCTAKSGAANNSIRRNVMNAVHKYKNTQDLFVVVMWSFPNRYEFRFNYDTGHRDSPWYSFNPWIYNNVDMQEHFHVYNPNILEQNIVHRENAEIKGINDFARSYIKNVAESEYWELYTSWSEIVMLQCYLLENNISFRFMYVDSCLFECNFSDISLRTLRESIDNKWFVCDEGMYNWAKRTKQEFYTTHPKESAHIEWINMLYDRIV
jgi:hypothetical protein